MPNTFAWFTLLATPVFALYAVRRWPPLTAAMIVVVGGAMFLPSHTAFNLPVLPPLNKEVIPALSALFAFAVSRPGALKAKAFRGPDGLMLIGAAATMFTALGNSDPLVYGPVVLPAQTLYDGFVDGVEVLIFWFPAFYLGRALVRNSRDLLQMVRFMVIAGLIYCIPIIIELRLSPRMHEWFYGFHQTQFLQTMRYGGYRPKVFMRHGLNVALFMTVASLLAVVLWRAARPLRTFWTPGRAAVFLVVIVVLCKSTGAYFHLAVMLPLCLFASPRVQGRVALGIAVIVIGYPLLRLNDYVPVQGITDWMKVNVNEERALSLWFRLDTEGQVLERARDRFLFGWGGYGRPYIYDAISGRQISVLDGYWVQELGQHGLVGFLCVFGMMCWPVLALARNLSKVTDPKTQTLLAGVGLTSILYVFDWLPNSSISKELTFMVGGLSGALPGILAEQRTRRSKVPAEPQATDPTAAVRRRRRKLPLALPASVD